VVVYFIKVGTKKFYLGAKNLDVDCIMYIISVSHTYQKKMQVKFN